MEQEKKENKNNESGGTKKQSALIRSMKMDANKFVREKKISLMDIFLKEKIKREAKSDGKIKIFFRFILLFLILGALSYLSFTLYNKYYKNPEKKVEREENIQKSLVYSEIINPIYIDEKDAKILVKEFLEKNNAKENLIYAPLIKNKKSINFNEFLSNLEIPAPYELVKNLENEFYFGAYGVSENKNNPVLVLKTKNFNPAYINMLKWEKNIVNDLSLIFALNSPVIPMDNNISKTAATTTSSSSSPSTSKITEFYDKTINNLDIRILDAENKTILLYGFFAEKYLIIVSSEETFKNIINRLKITLE